MPRNLLDEYRNSLFDQLPGNNRGLALLYAVGRLEEEEGRDNYLQRIVDSSPVSRPTVRDHVSESKLYEQEKFEGKKFVYLTEQGWRLFGYAEKIFESQKYDRVKEKAEELRDFLLRWPTEEELEILTDTEIDRSMRSHLARNCGWKEPSDEEIEAKKGEVKDLIRESLALMRDELPSGRHMDHFDKPDIVVEREISRYKSKNQKMLEKIDYYEDHPPEEDPGSDKVLVLTPTMQYLLDEEHLIQRRY